MKDNTEQDENVSPPLWEDTTLESLNLFIESQCSIEEVLALLDLDAKQIERKFKIKNFDVYFKSKQLAGLGRIKARCFSRALEGDAIMLRHLTQEVKIVGDAALVVNVIEMPDNGRVRKIETVE